MSAGPDWREGHRILSERIARLPRRLRETAAEPLVPLDLDAAEVGSFVVTGIGSSAAHARFLRHRLSRLGIPTRFIPLSEFVAGRPGGPADVLIVFSQGLSPNARLALVEPDRWKRVILATARRRGLDDLETAGVTIRRFQEEDELGTLTRVVGPLCGYWCALDLAREIGATAGREPLPDVDVDAVCHYVEASTQKASDLSFDPAWLDEGTILLTSGSYGELVNNLQLKLLEATLRPMPPAWDLLEFAHGAFQEAVGKQRTFLVLGRADSAAEPELVTRLRGMLDPELHRLVVLQAHLPEPFCVFEHEAMLDVLGLRFIEERRIDQVRWPGQGSDRPLYGIGGQGTPSPRLDLRSWPEVERALEAGSRTAVVALGATEQHGPHLPLTVDSRIADALAERLCRRIPGTLRLPALSLGCSPEHLDFPGTLSLEADTLVAVLRDVLRSLRRHGFERAFVFTAHGGNAAPLREAQAFLADLASPMQIGIFTDLRRVTERLWREAEALGVEPGAAGHHAGELETSIFLALEPSSVRLGALASGRREARMNAKSLFHPTLRPNAPNGVLGDPRGADGRRAERYLAAWTDLLEEAFRSMLAEPRKNRQ